MLFLEYGFLTKQDQHIMLIGFDTSRHFSYQISFAFQHWDSIVWKKNRMWKKGRVAWRKGVSLTWKGTFFVWSSHSSQKACSQLSVTTLYLKQGLRMK